MTDSLSDSSRIAQPQAKASQAMLYATGMSEDDMNTAPVGSQVSAWYEGFYQ